MPFNLGVPELIIILVILILLFGAKRLPEIARGIGKSTKEFRDAVKGEDETASDKAKSDNSRS